MNQKKDLTELENQHLQSCDTILSRFSHIRALFIFFFGVEGSIRGHDSRLGRRLLKSLDVFMCDIYSDAPVDFNHFLVIGLRLREHSYSILANERREERGEALFRWILLEYPVMSVLKKNHYPLHKKRGNRRRKREERIVVLRAG